MVCNCTLEQWGICSVEQILPKWSGWKILDTHPKQCFFYINCICFPWFPPKGPPFHKPAGNSQRLPSQSHLSNKTMLLVYVMFSF